MGVTKAESQHREAYVMHWITNKDHRREMQSRSPCLIYDEGMDFAADFAKQFDIGKDPCHERAYRMVCRILNRLVKEGVLRRHSLGCDYKYTKEEPSYCWVYSWCLNKSDGGN